jgi:hypothetical protein
MIESEKAQNSGSEKFALSRIDADTQETKKIAAANPNKAVVSPVLPMSARSIVNPVRISSNDDIASSCTAIVLIYIIPDAMLST